MNVFSKLLETEFGGDLALGSPARDEVQLSRRLSGMAEMTAGRGFRIPAKTPRVYADGKTRGQKRREALAVSNAKVSEARALEFLHSSRTIR